MTRPLVVWGGIVIRPTWVKARHADGRPVLQVRAAVLTRTKASAQAALGLTRGDFARYVSETGNAETIAAAHAAGEGVAIYHPLDPGHVLEMPDGTTSSDGWVTAP